MSLRFRDAYNGRFVSELVVEKCAFCNAWHKEGNDCPICDDLGWSYVPDPVRPNYHRPVIIEEVRSKHEPPPPVPLEFQM